jgi:mannosyltransferase
MPLAPIPAARIPVALVPAVLTAVVTGTEIGRPLLWRDELATWSAASRTLPQMWRLLRHTDAVLGPYYVLLHVWMGAIGDSAAAMRVPSAISMTVAAAVVAFTARRLAGNLAAVAAGTIFALIPAVSRYGQEARPYAFAVCLSALATLALLRAVERPGWRRWAAYALAIAAAGASSLVTLSLLAGHAVAALCLPGGRPPGRHSAAGRLAPLLAAGVVAVAIDAPLILAGRQQAMHQLDNLVHPGWYALVGVWPQVFSSGPAAVAVFALAALSLVSTRKAGAVAVAAALIPVLVIWAVSHGAVSYWTTRYLVFTLPAWAVVAGCGVTGIAERIPARKARYSLVAGAVAVAGLAGATAQFAIRQPQAHNWWTYPAPSGDIPVGYAEAADILAVRERPGDGVAYQVSDGDRWQVDTSVSYYLRHRRAPRTVFQELSAERAGLLSPVECAHPSKCLFGARRVWVVYIQHLVRGGRGGTPFQALLPAQTAVLHAAGYTVRRAYSAEGITVDLLVRSSQ